MKVLVVEDDIRLAQALSQILKEAGYEAEAVHDGESGLQWAESGGYDVVIMDVMLPKRDGISAVRELRHRGCSVPVLLLTARDSVSDRIHGYDSGADDYMSKPFSSAELLAHLRALLRRPGEVVFETLRFADLSLDLESFELSRIDGSGDGDDGDSSEKADAAESIRLSKKEFSLLRVLLANSGQVVSKEMLIDRVWGTASGAEDNNVEAYISFVRKKLGFLDSRVRIETIRKAGYRVVDGNDR